LILDLSRQDRLVIYTSDVFCVASLLRQHDAMLFQNLICSSACSSKIGEGGELFNKLLSNPAALRILIADLGRQQVQGNVFELIPIHLGMCSACASWPVSARLFSVLSLRSAFAVLAEFTLDELSQYRRSISSV